MRGGNLVMFIGQSWSIQRLTLLVGKECGEAAQDPRRGQEERSKEHAATEKPKGKPEKEPDKNKHAQVYCDLCRHTISGSWTTVQSCAS